MNDDLSVVINKFGVASGPAVPPGGTKNFQKYEKMFYTETKITVLLILKI